MTNQHLSYPILLNNLWTLILYIINIPFFDKWKKRSAQWQNLSFFGYAFDPESNLGIDKDLTKCNIYGCFKWKLHFTWFLESTPKYPLFIGVLLRDFFDALHTLLMTMKYPFFKINHICARVFKIGVRYGTIFPVGFRMWLKNVTVYVKQKLCCLQNISYITNVIKWLTSQFSKDSIKAISFHSITFPSLILRHLVIWKGLCLDLIKISCFPYKFTEPCFSS